MIVVAYSTPELFLTEDYGLKIYGKSYHYWYRKTLHLAVSVMWNYRQMHLGLYMYRGKQRVSVSLVKFPIIQNITHTELLRIRPRP